MSNRKAMTDFDRFKLYKAKQARNRILKRQYFVMRKAARKAGKFQAKALKEAVKGKQKKKGKKNLLLALLLLCLFLCNVTSDDNEAADEQEYFASPCEVCSIVTDELEFRLDETGRSHSAIETGYYIDGSRQKKKKYKNSELRLLDSMEKLCDRLLEYSLHKERKDISRFARGQSETFRTLEGLVAKGVKVDLGIPHEMWNDPPVEITKLKSDCENLLEEFEDDIEEWYWSQSSLPSSEEYDSSEEPRKTSLKDFLCRKRVLRGKDTQCLDERPRLQLKGDHDEL
ncbi:unnamed protein product [Cyprideis torosa]|uniref:DUF3456 domain-containing protein n=1 Tax=Cyprideis torosa TaxID=163714 RepID=A0A7R8ZJI8_9CRUS|nr:unnamed protein product [Cyprideis torosa]CAG0887072.1 unnamed protein product [Cyprideis torosa]